MSVNQIIRDAEASQSSHQQVPRRDVEWDDFAAFVCNPEAPDSVYQLKDGETFEQFPRHVAAVVSRSDHRDFPQHRIRIGAVSSNGRFFPNLSPRSDLQQMRSGNVSLDGTFAALKLVAASVEAFIQDEYSWHVDRYVQRTAGKGRGPEQAKPQVRSSGKTERERAKGKARPKRD